MADLLSLLSRGYFPKELPPPFKTVAFGHAVAAATKVYCDLAENTGPAKLGHHNLARPGNIYRRLGIPNPTKHVRSATSLLNSGMNLRPPLITLHSRSAHRLPVQLGEHSIRPFSLENLAEHRITTRAGKRHLLTADVTLASTHRSTHTASMGLAYEGRRQGEQERRSYRQCAR